MMNSQPMTLNTAIKVFLAFALAYFLSALIRAITATLSPTLTQEFALTAGDLGLLAGGYFPRWNWLTARLCASSVSLNTLVPSPRATK